VGNDLESRRKVLNRRGDFRRGFMKRVVLMLFSLFAFVPGSAFSQDFAWPVTGALASGTSFAVNLQYTDHRRGLAFGFATSEDSLSGPYGNLEYSGSETSFPVRGLVLGLSGRKTVDRSLAFVLSASYLFPRPTEAVDAYDWVHFRQGYVNQARTWTAELQWWNVEAGAEYQPWDGLAVLAGFRYDSLQTRLSDPSTMMNAAGFRRGFETDEGEVTINCYMPYVGLRIDSGNPDPAFKVGVIGSPWLPGEVDREFTLVTERRRRRPPLFKRFDASGTFDSGYLLELFAEYGVNRSGFRAALLAKYSLVYARATLEKKRITVGDGRFFADIEPVTFSFTRNLWILGGTFSLELPSLL
jgi:hypothetical protein